MAEMIIVILAIVISFWEKSENIKNLINITLFYDISDFAI